MSVCRPSFYAQRFQDFMAKTVFKKIPSCKLQLNCARILLQMRLSYEMRATNLMIVLGKISKGNWQIPRLKLMTFVVLEKSNNS